jgi:hypothetical protein
MKKIFVLLFGLPTMALSQTVKEKLIFANSDSSLIMGGYSFDKDGNYCFEAEKQPKKHYVINNDSTLGPFIYTSSSYSNSGSLSQLYNNSGDQGEFLYKNSRGIKFYGPIIGKIERQLTNYTTSRVALTVFNKDSIYYYLDGRLLEKQLKNKNVYSANNDWCMFSENGRAIYYLSHDSLDILYVDGKPIDTADSFYQMGIINSGKYSYARGERPKVKSKYSYMFYARTADTTIGPVRTVWKYFLNEDGSYYYSGDDNGPDYIIINDALYKDIEEIDNILLPNRSNYLFSFVEENQNKINANGKIYNYDCPFLLLPNMDTLGNFSFFGLKDYYLYKYINGKQTKEPLSRYGVRGKPLYISPTGSSVHYFKTDDSIFIYRDDELLLPAIADKGPFITEDPQMVLGVYSPKNKAGGKNQLVYFEYDSLGYFLFNEVLSRPMFARNTRQGKVGGIVLADLTDNGFFAIQKTGDKTYAINMNNSVYARVDGVDKISWDDYFFDGKELVFYAIKGLSFYQYIVTQ